MVSHQFNTIYWYHNNLYIHITKSNIIKSLMITLNNLRYHKVSSLVDVVKILKILPYMGMAAIGCRNSFNIFRQMVKNGLHIIIFCDYQSRGWSGGAMVLGKLPVPGRPTIWMIVGQGPIALAIGAGRGVVWKFLLSSILSLLCLPLFGRRPDID